MTAMTLSRHATTGFLMALTSFSVLGCASTRLVNTWQDTKYSGPPLTQVMVIDVSTQAGIRRTFEDQFVRLLEAKGVRAIASYTLIPEDGEVPRERLAEAVKESGVKGVLVTRLVNVQTQVYVAPNDGPPYYGFYGYYSWAWGGLYDAPAIYGYNVVVAETNLFDATKDTLIWSGTTETFPSANVQKGILAFATVITNALAANHLI